MAASRRRQEYRVENIVRAIQCPSAWRSAFSKRVNSSRRRGRRCSSSIGAHQAIAMRDDDGGSGRANAGGGECESSRPFARGTRESSRHSHVGSMRIRSIWVFLSSRFLGWWNAAVAEADWRPHETDGSRRRLRRLVARPPERRGEAPDRAIRTARCARRLTSPRSYAPHAHLALALQGAPANDA